MKFDPDYSIFGTLAGNIQPDQPIEETVISYVNEACISLYGDLRGMSFAQLFSEISSDASEGMQNIQQLVHKRQVAFEGRLGGKFVKFHSRVVDHPTENEGKSNTFIQAGITDITESIILKQLLYGTSEALKRAAEAADDDTGQHIARINIYSKHLAKLSGQSDSFIEEISKFAQLHDIGKIKIAEIIRLPRSLTDEEFNEVKKHPSYGGQMVTGLYGLDMAYDITMDHHERWDGTGYPHNKQKEDISVAGQIVAIVDVFDALVSARPYKKPFSYEKTLSIFTNGDGRVMPSHFAPKLLAMFLEHYDSFKQIHQESMKDGG